MIPFGCKEEKEIEIIPDYEKIYLPKEKLSELPQLISGNDQKLLDTIFKAYISYYPNYDTMGGAPTIDYKIMVSEEGEVEKIFMGLNNDKRINQLVLNQIQVWKFKPAKKDGVPVKAQYPMFITLEKGAPTEESEYLIAADEMPEPIGGLYAIQSKIRYPEEAKRNGVEGKVFIQAFIDETGNVVEAKVIKRAGYGLDRAAWLAVKQTKFSPGKKDGKPVKVQISIPIVFKLQ